MTFSLLLPQLPQSVYVFFSENLMEYLKNAYHHYIIMLARN